MRTDESARQDTFGSQREAESQPIPIQVFIISRIEDGLVNQGITTVRRLAKSEPVDFKMRCS